MQNNFQSFIAPARERSQIWRVLCTLCVFGALYFILSGLYFLGAIEVGFIPSLEKLRSGIFDSPVLMLTLLASFALWILSLVIPLWFFHKRSVFSLIGAGPKRFIVHFIVGAVGYGVFLFVLSLFDSNDIRIELNLDQATWVRFLIPGLLLLMIQVSAEELLFRGYLQQQIAARFKVVWPAILIPSLLFGAGHFSTKLGLEMGVMLVVMTTLLGIVLAEITYRTGSIAAAVGIHFINNLGGMFFVSFQEFASGLSLYIAPDFFDDPELMISTLQGQMVIFLSVIGLYYALRFYLSRSK